MEGQNRAATQLELGLGKPNKQGVRAVYHGDMRVDGTSKALLRQARNLGKAPVDDTVCKQAAREIEGVAAYVLHIERQAHAAMPNEVRDPDAAAPKRQTQREKLQVELPIAQ